MLYAIVALLVVIADQAVKYWVAADAVINSVGIRKLIPGVVSLVNVHNDGAAFSFLSGGGARIGFILVCGVFTVFVIIALATNMISGKVGRWSAVMVAAGGIGNCLDRILYGYVQDMFMLEFVNFAVFNVADIFITVFCIVFILYVIFGMREEDEDDEDEEEEEEIVEEKPRKLRRKARAIEEDDEEEEPAPRKRKQKAAVEEETPRKRDRKPEPEEEEVPHKVRRARTEVEDEPTRPLVNSRKARQAKYEDEYAQYKAQKAQRQRVDPEVQAPVRRSAISENDPFAEWDNASARAQKAQRQEAQSYQPAPARPVKTEAPKKAAPAEDTDDFDLDSILNEFKF